ncbi:unnamed protein product [Cochlearia groenlandica]
MPLTLCFRLLLLAAVAASLMAVTAAQIGGQVLQVELWCVAKNDADDSSLQTAIDWACGQGGADCDQIRQGGACNDATDLLLTASYVFNNYYLKNGLSEEACNFNNNAALTSINPSSGSCKYPSSKRVANGRVADDTSIGAGQADTSRGRQISSSLISAFIGFSSFLLTNTRIIHHI